MVAAIPRELTATLPQPPGINATYRAGCGRYGAVTRVYKSASATTWDQDAILILRGQGWKPLPAGRYWLCLCCTVFTCRLDIDAPLKALLDVVAAVLEVNDACIGALSVTKIPVKAKADQRLELVARVYPADDPDEWAARSRAAIPIHETRLARTSS